MLQKRKLRNPSQELTEDALDKQAAQISRLARDPTLIRGIFNYCDRWCERCPQTARCLVFKTEQARNRKRGGTAVTHDLENQEFWDDLAGSFALALHMVRRDAKRHGIDLDAPGVMATAEAESRQRRQQAARSGRVLHRTAAAYWKSAKRLLDRLPDELRSTEEALNTQARLGTGNPHAQAAELRDAVEVVQWYLCFIDVKLQRAVGSRVEESEEGDNGFTSDADGSAKVALVAIDRSISAWARLRDHLAGGSDTVLDLLARLERLRRAVERDFPKARSFKRPGFE